MNGKETTDSYYVIGEARTNRDNAITMKYGSFYMAFEIDDETEEVLDFGCTHTLKITEQYLKRWFMGANFPNIADWLEERLAKHYGGSSRRAITTAYHDALKRYRLMKENHG